MEEKKWGVHTTLRTKGNDKDFNALVGELRWPKIGVTLPSVGSFSARVSKEFAVLLSRPAETRPYRQWW
jgi:hypothetical protein